MLFKSKNRIYNFVYYNQKSNIILIEFCLKNMRKYYKINDSFFKCSVLPLLRLEMDIRGIIYFAIENQMASYVEPRDIHIFGVDDVGVDRSDYMRVVK